MRQLMIITGVAAANGRRYKMGENNRIYVSEAEYARLCRVDGRMDALIDYIKDHEYIDRVTLIDLAGRDNFESLGYGNV